MLELPLKVVDGLTWPWRVALRLAFQSCLAVMSQLTSSFLWAMLIPYRMLAAAFSEAETRRRLQLLQAEFDRMAASVIELENRLESERQERWKTTAKLQKALQQRNELKNRVLALATEVRELRAAKAQAEEDAKLAREARVRAEADVARASRVLREFEREAEARASREVLGRRTVATPTPSFLVPDEEQVPVPPASEAGLGGGGGLMTGSAVSSLNGGRQEPTGRRTTPSSSTAAEALNRTGGVGGFGGSRHSQSVNRWLIKYNLACACLAALLAFCVHRRGPGQGLVLVWALLVLAILSPAFMMAFLRRRPSRALLVLCLSWALFGFFASLAWPILVPPVPRAVETVVQTAIQAVGNQLKDSEALAAGQDQCQADFSPVPA